MLGFPAMGYGDPDYYPSLLLSTLARWRGCRRGLFQEIREKRGLVYSIYSFASPFIDGGLFGIYAGTGEDEAKELMPVTLAELRKVQKRRLAGRVGPGARPGEGRAADVARKHGQPL